MTTLRPTGLRGTDRFFVIGLGLIPVLALTTGCAQSPARSLSRAWDDLPKLRWATSRNADEGVSDDTEIAAKSGASDSDKSSSTLSSRFKFSTWSSDVKPESTADDAAGTTAKKTAVSRDPFLADELATRKIAARSESDEQQDSDEEPHVASHRDRLRAALSDDSRRNRQPNVDVAEQDRLRLRVESLMGRASELLDRGELVAAQRAVELAQSLADDGALEFAPDEERPVDLLTKIVARIDAKAAQAAVTAAESDAEDSAQESAGDELSASVDDQVADEIEFDPYAERNSALRPAPRRASMFDSSLVVLGSPSFEEIPDNTAVKPTAYARRSDRGTATLALSVEQQEPIGKLGEDFHQTLPQVQDEAGASEQPTDQAAEITESESVLPAPPTVNGPSFGSIDLPPLSEDEMAPAPPVEVRPARAGTVSLQEIDAESAADAESAEQIRAAEFLPRWLTLSVLSLLVACFCVWLVRRRSFEVA